MHCISIRTSFKTSAYLFKYCARLGYIPYQYILSRNPTTAVSLHSLSDQYTPPRRPSSDPLPPQQRAQPHSPISQRRNPSTSSFDPEKHPFSLHSTLQCFTQKPMRNPSWCSLGLQAMVYSMLLISRTSLTMPYLETPLPMKRKEKSSHLNQKQIPSLTAHSRPRRPP